MLCPDFFCVIIFTFCMSINFWYIILLTWSILYYTMKHHVIMERANSLVVDL